MGLKIYVASSWRNLFQLKDAEGFSWREVDPEWERWTPQQYINGLEHECAERGFRRDMAALKTCDACVMVHPCGMSASLEAGWAAGNGKLLLVYTPAIREPDLMVKMADLVTNDLARMRKTLSSYAEAAR